MRSSAGLSTTSSILSASDITATVQAEVWIRPCVSWGGTRWTRSPPGSHFIFRAAPPAPLQKYITPVVRVPRQQEFLQFGLQHTELFLAGLDFRFGIDPHLRIGKHVLRRSDVRFGLAILPVQTDDGGELR